MRNFARKFETHVLTFPHVPRTELPSNGKCVVNASSRQCETRTCHHMVLFRFFLPYFLNFILGLVSRPKGVRMRATMTRAVGAVVTPLCSISLVSVPRWTRKRGNRHSSPSQPDAPRTQSGSMAASLNGRSKPARSVPRTRQRR